MIQIQISNQHKAAIVEKLLEQRTKFTGTDQQFAKQWNINYSVYSRLKTATDFDGLLNNNTWIELGLELDVNKKNNWQTVETAVFKTIKEDLEHCQEGARSLMYVDNCGIGKTYTAKYLSKTLANVFYIDASQAKTKQVFIRTLARTIGVDDKGHLSKVKSKIKYILKVLPKPVVMIDEAGDLDYPAFLDIKELWNGTENTCGWYLMGADGLREKIDRGIGNKKVGFAEIFSRFGERYSTNVPLDDKSKKDFYRELITSVAKANLNNKAYLNELVNKCLVNKMGEISGLRAVEDLVILYNKN